MVADLVVSLQIETSPTVFVECEDDANGYWVEGGAFASRDTTFRQTSLDTPWTEGSVVITSVRENVIEAVTVYVKGPDHHTFDLRVKTITDALEQLAYQIKKQVGNGLQIWDCLPAQYSIETQQEYQLATMGLIRAQVPRYPTITLEAV